MKFYLRIIVIFLSALLVVGFLTLTNPQTLPISYLLIPFALTAIFFYQIFSVFMVLFRLGEANGTKQRLAALLFSILATNFLILQSIGRLTLQDIILASVISIVVSVYISKFQISSK